ncbi:MAG: cytochrome b N-terminal domain-containing protein [Desulfobulbaceae bacterium]|uniref:Cytochrome b N-terminal domain-containing protein n=1 Tax=Candidatus Desulfobia pelagia TaxID=2841692 RepID=A0A8J6TEZ7_9BACT|nr:cytochrome b N-terminal domain-containing protein [Candidatus Desulfobia pelagia]
MNIAVKITDIKWGEKSLISLYVSVVSGLVLALQYNPEHPFYSAVSLDMLIPFGAFWRSLHFYSSQIFFLLSAVHLLAIIYNGSYLRLSLAKWIILVGTLPAGVLLLFTGYVLRGDITGESAGIIAEQLCLTIPYIGELLNSMLFALLEEGVKRVYANHLIGLGVIWGILAWDHLRRYRVSLSSHGLLILLMTGMALLWDAPMETMQPGMTHIAGPWFFLGIQELLRYIHPLWSGVLFPLVFVVAVAVIRVEDPWRKRAVFFSIAWLFIYGVATVIALFR